MEIIYKKLLNIDSWKKKKKIKKKNIDETNFVR